MGEMAYKDPYVPTPDTCHPVYEPQASVIRPFLDVRSAIQVALPRRPERLTWAGGTPKPTAEMRVDVKTLVVKKCWGPAPFVGDPLWQEGGYFWKVAIDDLGRHVSGSSRLEIIASPDHKGIRARMRRDGKID